MTGGDLFAYSTPAVATAKAVIALAGAALLALDLVLGPGARAALARRVLLGATALAALLAWMRFAPLAAVSFIHPWEQFHHVLGARYFAELGYTRLYDCTALADAEAGFAVPPAERPLRRLATNQVERASAALADPDACKRHFTPARWRAFAQDVAFFRAAFMPRIWGSILTDHGFNASPVWTLAGAALAGDEPVRPALLRRLARIDLLLLAGAFAAAFWSFGFRAGCAALIFFGTSHLSDFRWVGGAFLRFDWLALAVAGAALVRRGHGVAGGFALTWATLLRVFPGFLVAAVVLHAAIDLARRRSLALAPPHRRFALGCLLALATLVPLSVAATGRDAWPGFVANSRKHLGTPLLNFVGWKSVVSFDPGATAAALRDRSDVDWYGPWEDAVRERFERRRAAWAAGVAGFVALLGFALARTPLAWAPLLGVGLVVVAAQIGSYYWSLLLGWGLLAERVPALGPLLLVASAASLGVADVVEGSADAVFAALSALGVALAFAVTALAARRGGHTR
ncbi:MAG: hypothetical protein DCC71_19320 [Proteobacteria bacterium]|nr:MAG: hypothetical protein DCC71_19320 [Pseudomonadota bacterium]